MQYDYYAADNAFDTGPYGKSRGIAAILAIFLGWIGIQYFYLGKTTAGVIFLIGGVLTCTTVTSILSLVQGIMMLCMTNRQFEDKYVTTRATLPLF